MSDTDFYILKFEPEVQRRLMEVLLRLIFLKVPKKEYTTVFLHIILVVFLF